MSAFNACSYVHYKSTQQTLLQGDTVMPVIRARSNACYKGTQ